MSDADFDLLAAALRADAADLHSFVEALATKLEGAFADLVSVDRTGGRLGGKKRVRRIALRLADDEYELSHDGGRVACRRRTVVRGIALKTEELPLEEWIDDVSRTLVATARATERGRVALGRLLDA